MRRSSGRGEFREGDRVEARFRGKDEYFPGTIRTDRGDGTYDVAYDDGATETRIREDLIRSLRESRRSGGEAFEAGDRVEARYKGRDRWEAGKVRRAHLDGTYDIEYDDGEREVGVREAHVRKLASRGSRRDDDDADEQRRLKQRLRDLEDRLADERSGRIGRLEGRSRSSGRYDDDADDHPSTAALLRENREMRAELKRLGTSGSSKFLENGKGDHGMPPWHAMVSANNDDVIEELCAAIGSGHGSVGQWLNTRATPLEKRNFIEFVQTLEQFEGRRGLTPQTRAPDDGSGTILLSLGPTIRAQLKFIV